MVHGSGEPRKTERNLDWRKRAAREPGSCLFESTAEDGAERRTLLFSRPIRVLTANRRDEVRGLLDELQAELQRGRFVAGYLTYEAGAALMGIGGQHIPDGPLAWFGVYLAPEIREANDRAAAGESAWTEEPGKRGARGEERKDDRPALCVEMEMPWATYAGAVAAVQERIAAGETYQVNLTTGVRFGYRGEVASLYTAMAEQQMARYAALLHPAAGRQVLSISPELFFRVEPGRKVVVRPMKGTAALEPGGNDPVAQERWLQKDGKNRAEHVMIVDLLRNDLGRVCETGSVAVEQLFAVERYRTLLQMTSTISGQLRDDAGFAEIVAALFPSGSMTGAPKRRTMEVIEAIEPGPRGIYSGAIGFAAPDGTCAFNVAIRTVVLEQGLARMGVGGGVVADSQAHGEYAECWLKAKFLLQAARPYRLVETMRWDGEYGFLQEHLERLEVSAQAVGYRFDRVAVAAQLREFGRGLAQPQRVRLLLDRDGTVQLETSALRLWKAAATARLCPEPVWSGDSFLRHKTDFRPVYDAELARAMGDGFDDVLFVNERGEFTEGSISSVLFRLAGAWVTPPLSAGALPGVARALLLHRGAVREQTVRREDLPAVEAIALANGIRGTAALALLELPSGETLRFPATEDVPQL